MFAIHPLLICIMFTDTINLFKFKLNILNNIFLTKPLHIGESGFFKFYSRSNLESQYPKLKRGQWSLPPSLRCQYYF